MRVEGKPQLTVAVTNRIKCNMMLQDMWDTLSYEYFREHAQKTYIKKDCNLRYPCPGQG